MSDDIDAPRPLEWRHVCSKCGIRTISRDPELTTCPVPTVPVGPDTEVDDSTPRCGAEYEDYGYAYYDELHAHGWAPPAATPPTAPPGRPDASPT